MPGYELVGGENSVGGGEANGVVELVSISSRRACQDLCLRETRIVCRSATYDAREHICRLSADTRRSAPHRFRRASHNLVDYMENECAQRK